MKVSEFQLLHLQLAAALKNARQAKEKALEAYQQACEAETNLENALNAFTTILKPEFFPQLEK